MILDSSFVMDLLKGEKSAVKLAQELEEVPVSTTSITVFEIFQGAKDSELAPIRKFFAQMKVLPLGHDEAERGGLIDYRKQLVVVHIASNGILHKQVVKLVQRNLK